MKKKQQNIVVEQEKVLTPTEQYFQQKLAKAAKRKEWLSKVPNWIAIGFISIIYGSIIGILLFFLCGLIFYAGVKVVEETEWYRKEFKTAPQQINVNYNVGEQSLNQAIENKLLEHGLLVKKPILQYWDFATNIVWTNIIVTNNLIEIQIPSRHHP